MADVVLIEKYATDGLSLEDIEALYSRLDSDTAYPVEFGAHSVESSAMGFISPQAASKLGYETDPNSDIACFVASILDDVDNESDDGFYDFEGIEIYLTR